MVKLKNQGITSELECTRFCIEIEVVLFYAVRGKKKKAVGSVGCWFGSCWFGLGLSLSRLYLPSS